MAVVASDTYNQRNQGVPTDESIEAWLDIARAAERGRHPRPGDGLGGVRLSVRRRNRRWSGSSNVARRVAEARPFEIALADTIGVGVPTQVTEIVSARARGRARHSAALPLSQHPQHRLRQCVGRAARRRAHARCQPRRHRRLPVCAGGDGQHRRPKTCSTCCIAPVTRPASRSMPRSKPASGCRSSSGAACPACWRRRADFRGRRHATA